MIKCAECGFENMDGLDYCDGCGASLESSPSREHALEELVLKREIQSALRGSLDELEPDLSVLEETIESVRNTELPLEARDKSGVRVIVGLVAGRAEFDVLVQVLSRMSDGTEIERSRGILIAGDFSDRTVAAARQVPNIQLRKYTFRFSFAPVR